MNENEKYPTCPPEPCFRRVGYAYVPIQRLCKVYSPCKALEQGTVFPELDISLEDYQRGLWNGK